MKFINKLINSGLLVQPIVLIVIVKWLQKNNPRYLDDPTNYPVLLLLSFFPVLLIWAGSIGKPRKEIAITGREAAKYPPVPKPLLHKDPTGTVVLGKDKHTGKYVGKKVEEPGHLLIIGGSGSGKSSSLIISTLLANPALRAFFIDVKGELHSKATKIGDKSVMVFDPQDRTSYGYDPLYLLNEESSSQQIYECMDLIAASLIKIQQKDPFWGRSARGLTCGLFCYFYKQGIRNFISIVDEILGRPAKENITTVLDNSRPNSPEYHCLIQFKDMADETLGGIVAEMNSHLTVFANDMDIRYAFRDNPDKLSPLDLEQEEPKKYFLSIREENLTRYYDVLQICINQVLAQMEKRPEDSEPLVICIDELPRLLSTGKIDKLLDSVRTLRSRRVGIILVSQSVEALQIAYSEPEVTDLMSNCSFITILGASSPKTIKAVTEWSGQYTAQKLGWSGSEKDRRINTNFEEQNVVKPEDLMTLQLTGDAILISQYGYSRIKKTPYYKDKYFKPIADEIRKHNEAVE